MSTTVSTAMVLAEDPARQAETLAMVGFLAGYGGATRTSYTTDLRIFAAWCHESDLSLFEVRRAHLEMFGRQMEENGRMRSTVARRLSRRWPASSSTANRSNWSIATPPSTCAVPRSTTSPVPWAGPQRVRRLPRPDRSRLTT